MDAFVQWNRDATHCKKESQCILWQRNIAIDTMHFAKEDRNGLLCRKQSQWNPVQHGLTI